MKPFLCVKLSTNGSFLNLRLLNFHYFCGFKKVFILKIYISNGKVAGKSRTFI